MSSRDRWILVALCGVIPAAACTRLTSVDWSQIKPADANGGTTPTSMGGEGGEIEAMGGSDAGGEAGLGGAFEGGAAGMDTGGSSGTAGGGMGGVAGSTGGIAGGGMGGISGGGMGGTGGTDMGGMSGSGGSPIVIIGGAGAIAQAIVMYDGGSDAPNGNFGGRLGLNARCESHKGALPHSKTVAFISVSPTDELFSLTTNAQVPTNKQIVSRGGVLLADNWQAMLGDGGQISGGIRVSLRTAGVVPETAKRWLSGSVKAGTVDLDNTCTGWTSSLANDTAYQARYGRVDTVLDQLTGDTWLSALRVTCSSTNNNVLCLAYDPQ